MSDATRPSDGEPARTDAPRSTPERAWPAALYAAAFAGIGVQLPYFPVWLEQQGLGPFAIGALVAIPVLTRILVTAPLMALVDRGLSARTLLLAANGALALAYAACLLAPGLALLAVIVVAIAIAQAPIISATDLVALEAMRRRPGLDYGRTRLWGSITFLAASLGAGYALGIAGPDAAIALLVALALAAMFVARLAAPARPRARTAGEKPAAPSRTPLPGRPWLVMAAGACTQASHAALYAFGSIHWRELGYSGATIGWLWAIGVLAEILVFAGLGRSVGRARLGLFCLVAGSAAALLRFAVMALDPGLAATFALQVLHGLTFGATHLGTMAGMAALAPERARGRAQGTLSALGALATALGTTASGIVYAYGGAYAFTAMTPLAAAGLGFALFAARAPQPQRARSGG